MKDLCVCVFCVPASVVPFDMEELIDSLVSGRFRAVLSLLFTAAVLFGLHRDTRIMSVYSRKKYVAMQDSVCVCVL